MRMTNKNLARRLERLEALLLPATEERILILNFITGDGEVVGKREFKLSTDRRPIKRNRRWQRWTDSRGVFEGSKTKSNCGWTSAEKRPQMWFVRAVGAVWRKPGCLFRTDLRRSSPALDPGEKSFGCRVSGLENEALAFWWVDPTLDR
jgi:hypothetical protein